MSEAPASTVPVSGGLTRIRPTVAATVLVSAALIAFAWQQAPAIGPGGPLSSAELAAHRELVTGTYSGAGLTLTADHRGRVSVSRVAPGSPAAASGLLVGDVVVRVADADVSGSATSEVAGLLRGSVDSKVNLVVRRGDDSVDVHLRRAAVPVADVAVRDLADGIRVVRIERFSAGVVTSVRHAIDAGPRPSGVVLDLRDNPGGLVTQAVGVAGLFMNPGTVAFVDRVDGAGGQGVLQTSQTPVTRAPMVVLVDSGSASAAELLTGALQDRGRAVIVGARTYGKGTVQLVDAGGQGSETLSTAATYLTPDGRAVNGVGLTPDVLLSDPVADDSAFEAARSILAGQA